MSPRRPAITVPAVLGLLAISALGGCSSGTPSRVPGSSVLEDGGRFLLAAPKASRLDAVTADDMDLLARRRHRQCLALEEQITDGQFLVAVAGLRQMLVELESPRDGVPDATGEFSPRLRFWLAYCHEELEESAEARALYNEVMAEFPQTRWARLAHERLTAMDRSGLGQR